MFSQFEIDEDTILIGHSIGAGFLVRWLSENKIKVGKVILVASFIDPFKEYVEESFFDIEIDSKISERTKELTVFISKDDFKDVLVSVKHLKEKLTGLKIKEFEDKGHFTLNSMRTNEFSELMDVILK